MGVACYVEANDPRMQEATQVDGKAIGRNLDALSALAADNGMKRLDAYISIPTDEAIAFLVEELGAEEAEIDEARLKEKWYSASEGIWYFSELGRLIREHTEYLTQEQGLLVLQDIDDYLAVLEQIRVAGALWHLAVDP